MVGIIVWQMKRQKHLIPPPPLHSGTIGMQELSIVCGRLRHIFADYFIAILLPLSLKAFFIQFYNISIRKDLHGGAAYRPVWR